MTRSRLSRRVERQTKKTFFLSLLGIVAILLFLFKFGVPLLANFGLFLANVQGKTEVSEKRNNLSFVQAPLLDPLPSATNSAQLTISGTASTDQTVNLYINGVLLEKTQVNSDDSKFIFENITLSSGENLISAKAVTKDPTTASGQAESDFSKAYSIVFEKDAPSLTIDSPSNNQSFQKDDNTANVRGKTDAGIRVTVNDFWAIVDSSGNFSYTLPLKSGENAIKVIATDQAGNTTEKEIKVTYSP